MRRLVRVLGPVMLLVTLCVGATARADTLRVAVAANFLDAFTKLGRAFRTVQGHTLVASVGSTGQLYAQITQGAPFDLFLSADTERPRALEASGLTLHGSRFIYATGTLVLWTPKPSIADPRSLLPRLTHIAVADPKTAPYGAAAQRVLVALGHWERLRGQGKVVTGASIAQAHQLAASGAVDCAFVALSQVLGLDGRIPGSFWRVPSELSGNLDQAAVALKRTTKPALALQFLRWLRTDPEARRILLASGYRAGEA
jgi:molybdate transport system substrate-binding protein